MRTSVLLPVGMLLLIALSSAAAQPFPSVGVTTLGGDHLQLPAALNGHPSLLVIGFTQASERQTSVWRKRIQADVANPHGLIVYPVIVIQQIPRIFHGLLIAGIRAGVTRSTWGRFLVVDNDEAAWKAAIGWRGANLAYVVLLDSRGRIVWQRYGSYSAQGERSLRARLVTLGHPAPTAR